MGRTVSYKTNASIVLYFELGDVGKNEEGEFCQDIYQFEYECFMDNFIEGLKKRFPSFYKPADKTCDFDRECFPILKNKLVTLYLSEYNGMFSLSIVPNYYCYRNYDYNYDTKALEQHYAEQIEKNMKKIIMENAVLLNRTSSWTFERVNP